MLIARVRLELAALALDEAFDAVPEMSVEAERIAAHSTQWTMPCLWVAADDVDAVDDALEADPSIDTIVETTDFGDEKYYHLEWEEKVNERITEYIDRDGSILLAEATSAGWELQIRFTSRDQFDAFRESLAERDHSFELLSLSEPGAPRQTMGEVTPSQRDALVTAAEHGYYKVPRETSTQELADELEMSHQALSELLRRGTDNLVNSALVTNPDEEAAY